MRCDWSWLSNEKLQELVDEHHTLEATAQHLGVHRTKLSGLIQRRGITIQYDWDHRRKRQSGLNQYSEILKHLASVGWSCSRIVAALELPVQAEAVRRWLRANGVELLVHRGAPKHEWNPAWSGGKGRISGTLVEGSLEHRRVVEQELGRPLTDEEVVRHTDENPKNNDPGNLVLFPNQADHMRHHHEQWQAIYQERLKSLQRLDSEYVRSLGW